MSVTITETIYVPDRASLREWLLTYHKTKQEIWLLYPDKATGRARIPYDDAVEEALCFGWIDGIGKRYDEQHAAQRFTPRTKKSNWSELNKHRARRLLELGLIQPAGLAVLPDLSMRDFVVPADILQALQADEQTWVNYQAFPEYYQQIRIGYIDEVRSNSPVFQSRLANFLKQTRLNKRFGTIK